MSAKINFVIETAVAQDYKHLNYVNKETWLHTYPSESYNINIADIENLPWNKFEENWKARLTLPEKDFHCHVAKVDNNIVGFIVCKELPSFISIGSVYVLPDYQKLGMGTSLFNHVLKFVSLQKPIEIKVAEYNQKSINFYKKLGFVYLEQISDFQLSENKFIPQIKMILRR